MSHTSMIGLADEHLCVRLRMNEKIVHERAYSTPITVWSHRTRRIAIRIAQHEQRARMRARLLSLANHESRFGSLFWLLRGAHVRAPPSEAMSEARPRTNAAQYVYV